jgi:hypothetical protein
MSINGGQNEAAAYIMELATKQDILLANGHPDLEAIKRILTADQLEEIVRRRRRIPGFGDDFIGRSLSGGSDALQ